MKRSEPKPQHIKTTAKVEPKVSKVEPKVSKVAPKVLPLIATPPCDMKHVCLPSQNASHNNKIGIAKPSSFLNLQNRINERSASEENIASKRAQVIKDNMILANKVIAPAVDAKPSGLLDNKVRSFVDNLSEMQKLLQPASKPSVSMQRTLQMLNARDDTAHTTSLSDLRKGLGIGKSSVNNSPVAERQSLVDVSNYLEKNKELQIIDKNRVKSPSEKFDEMMMNARSKKKINVDCDKNKFNGLDTLNYPVLSSDDTIKSPEPCAKPHINGIENSSSNLVPSVVDSASDERTRSPITDCSIVVPDLPSVPCDESSFDSVSSSVSSDELEVDRTVQCWKSHA